MERERDSHLLVAAVDAVVDLGAERPVARARYGRVLTPDETVGAVLHCVETAVTVVVDVAVVEIGVVAVLLDHAEFGHAAFAVAARLRLALVLESANLC